MCVVSMVFDHYRPRIDPWWERIPPIVPVEPLTLPAVPAPPPDYADLLKLIEDFKKSVEAARTVDKLTEQPDCADPEKAKLEQRVKELEDRIAVLEGRKTE